jgi:DGQHR domain-containing protein
VHPTGRELEDIGYDVFTGMGLVCAHRLSQVPLKEIDPAGAYSRDDHLEFDYLIPYEGTCLIGEMKGGRNHANIERDYTRFKRHFNMARGWSFNEDNLRLMGVEEDKLRNFRGIRQVRGFFVVANLQKFDVDLSEDAQIARFYRSDWELLKDYAATIGPYTKPHFLDSFELRGRASRRALMLGSESNSLTRTDYKKIASDVGDANIYTFEASPYELLPVARVYRRDELPDLSSTPEPEYQRSLIPKKLKSIRDNLLSVEDFMFPNSILVVLNGCDYQEDKHILTIPGRYGALSVIDGQHRLFSYADKTLEERLADRSRIMVTAIQFVTSDQSEVAKYSARTFVEINTNQTKVQTTHIDAIAYEILGKTDSRALAAQIILRANVRRRTALHGLFDTNQTGLGIIKSTTVLTTLKSITDMTKIQELATASGRKALKKRRGYENLFQAKISDLSSAEAIIEQGVVCMLRYFGLIAKVFSYDWPERGKTKNSSLEFAKIIAGFVQLLSTFISEGLDWGEVESELTKIRSNVMKLRRITNYDAVLFDPNHRHIANATPSASNDYHFLNYNRKRPTSIEKIMKRKPPSP